MFCVWHSFFSIWPGRVGFVRIWALVYTKIEIGIDKPGHMKWSPKSIKHSEALMVIYTHHQINHDR